jgi:epoxyqueuosine reductase
MDRELTQSVKHHALQSGADLAAVVSVAELPEHTDSICRILPGATSVLVVASRHSLGALRSQVNEMAQFDTIHAYHECARAAHAASRFLELKGFLSLAVPAFLPIDMSDAKKGMRGEICWRRAGVRAGLGSYGENGLLVTTEYGSAIRLAGVVTTAELEADAPLEQDVCDHCRRCIDACPAQALSGGGRINKKLCGDEIFKYGFRYFARFMQDVQGRTAGDFAEILKGHGLRELWQTFMTGNYYYCFQCQSQCPATKLPQPR